MRFIVTGGLGFIGHNVVRQLKAQGHECIVLDSVTNYGFINKAELAYLKRERIARVKNTPHHIDLRDHKEVENFFRAFSSGTHAVIHLASFPRQKVVSKNPVWGSDVMASGLVNLLELTKAFDIPRFIYISSSMVYGDFTDGVKEDAVCKPQGQYAIMKLMGEDLVRDYTRRGCFDHTIIRPSAVYGEYDVEDRVISKFILAALRGQVLKVNGANERLDFTHVDDAAQGIVSAVLSQVAVNKTYNITRGVSHTLEEAASIVIDTVGGGTIETGDRDTNFPSRASLDIRLAREELGFNPTIDLPEGVERYVEWFKDSSYWKKNL